MTSQVPRPLAVKQEKVFLHYVTVHLEKTQWLGGFLLVPGVNFFAAFSSFYVGYSRKKSQKQTPFYW